MTETGQIEVLNEAVLGVLLNGLESCRRALGENGSNGVTDTTPLVDDWRELLRRCCNLDLIGSPTVVRLNRIAERLAAGGEITNEIISRQLRPVFDNLEFGTNQKTAPRRYGLRRLTATTASNKPSFIAASVDAVTSEELAAHRHAFERELEQLKQRLRWEDFDCVYSHLLCVLQMYGWCLPAGSDSIDVSIYSHRKSSAAIAACLLARGTGEIESLDVALTRDLTSMSERDTDALSRPISVLVKGDISGTQDFLYLMTSAGAARGLRGRSFYLHLLVETIARWILRQFGLPVTNLLFAGGGHFYLLLPVEELKTRWNELHQTISQKLWRAHQGDLSLAMGWVEVTARDFIDQERGFAKKWDEVSEITNEQKQREWIELGGEGMFEMLFTARQRGTTAEELCQICVGEYDQKQDGPMNNDIRRCRRCKSFEDLGKLLCNATHLVTFAIPDSFPPENGLWNEILNSFGASVQSLAGGIQALDIPSGAIAVHIEHLQEADFAANDALDRDDWHHLSVSYGFQLLADATPRKTDGEIADFADLAGASDGVKWLGMLRMDVDDLGRVFREGLGNHATIARMSTMSESLRWFFEGYVPHLCRRYNRLERGDKDRLYLIYAGGNDLFVVGAWSALPHLAREIRDEFRKFVGGDRITLSGGIAIEHQKYPLYQLAADAKFALDDRAKAFRPAKNGICFLQMPVGWEQFRSVDQWHRELTRMLQDKKQKVSRTILTRLSEIHALYEENAKLQDRTGRKGQLSFDQMQEERHYARWLWRLVYHLNRFAERHPNHRENIRQFQRELALDDDSLIQLLRIIARWTELRTREVSL